MNGEYMSLETAKRIKQLEKEIANLNNDATHLLKLHKKDKERIDKAIEYIEELGTQDGILKDYRIDKYIKEDLLNILRGGKEQ